MIFSLDSLKQRTMSQRKKASDLFIECLVKEGAKYVFALPGEENLDLIESIRKHPSLQLIILRHEQGAGFMAATHGRMTGRAGVCLTTLGPGATNVLTAVAHAQLGGMPMLVITGQKPIRKNTQGLFQNVDIVGIMRPITKKAIPLSSAEEIPAAIREAFVLAETSRPGVVHLELPEDVAEERTALAPLPRMPFLETCADRASLEHALYFFQEAEYPLFLLGMHAKKKGMQEALTSLIEASQIPFITTQMGKGAMDESSPYFVGTAAMSEGEKVHEAIAQADLVVAIGHDPMEKPPFLRGKQRFKILHLGEVLPTITQTYAPNYVLLGDVVHSLDSLGRRFKMMGGASDGDIAPFLVQKREKVTMGQSKNGIPLPIQKVVQAVENLFPKEGILALDNGLYKLAFARDYTAHHPHGLLLDNALATMGAGLPAAMAAKLLEPERKVCAICGDGGFMMNAQELESAIRLGLDLLVLILRDDAYGMIRWKQQKFGFDDFGMSFRNPNFVQYAQAYGAQGYNVEDLMDFKKKLRTCLRSKGVHVIDVPISYVNFLA